MSPGEYCEGYTNVSRLRRSLPAVPGFEVGKGGITTVGRGDAGRPTRPADGARRREPVREIGICEIVRESGRGVTDCDIGLGETVREAGV